MRVQTRCQGWYIFRRRVEGYAEQGLEGVQRGLSPDVIQEEALLMGLGDAAMGKVMGNAGNTTLLKSLLEGAGTGAVSSILTNEADTLLAGERSHVALDYQIGRAAGLSDEEARQAASIKEVKRIVLDALQGMSMAGVFHTAGKIIRVADAYLGFEDRGNLTDDGNVLRNLEESANIQRKERATGGTGEDETGIGRNLKKPPVVEELDGDGRGVGEGGSRSAQGLTGRDFENYLNDTLGGDGSFSVGGREFDGGVGNRWWEAKSGNYWDMLEDNPSMLAKFKSDMGNRLRIATDNGATYELFSNTPIPELIKQWLIEKGISFTELLD